MRYLLYICGTLPSFVAPVLMLPIYRFPSTYPYVIYLPLILLGYYTLSRLCDVSPSLLSILVTLIQDERALFLFPDL